MGIITGVVALGFLLLMGVVVYSLFSETIDTIIYFILSVISAGATLYNEIRPVIMQRVIEHRL